MGAPLGPGCCGDGAAFGDPPLDGPVLTISAGDAISLPLTWTQPAVLGPDGVTVVTPAVPVNMTGMTPSGEFLTYGQQPWTGVQLAMSNFLPLAGSFLLTGPGRGQPGDLTSGLPTPSPAKILGPRIRVSYTDAAGSHTFGTYYLAVK